MNWKDKWKDAWNEIGNMSLRELFTFTKKEKWICAIFGVVFAIGMIVSIRGVETITASPGWIVGYVHRGGAVPDYVSYIPQKTFEDKGDVQVDEKLNIINDASEEFFKMPFIKVDRIQRTREDYLFKMQSDASSVKPVEGPLFTRGSVKKSV